MAIGGELRRNSGTELKLYLGCTGSTVLESCSACGVIRNYAIHTRECRIVHAGFMPLAISNSLSSSILMCFFVPGFVMPYDPNGIELDVPSDTEQNVSSVTKLDVLSRLKFSSLTGPIFHFLYNLPHRTQDGPSPRELLGPFDINLSKLKWEKEKQELHVDKS